MKHPAGNCDKQTRITTFNVLSALICGVVAICATPQNALAQAGSSATSTVNIIGEVERSCVLGQPANVTLNLGGLTGFDGRIQSALASATPSASTQIEVAWCNVPSWLSLDAEPMSLQTAPAYDTPGGFTRYITYDATLKGWPLDALDRPLLNVPPDTATARVEATTAHARSLTLEISALEALNAAGSAPEPTAFLEAGAYAGSVIVSLTVQ